MANNDRREPNIKKRGRPTNKLTVKLFLLDPDHEFIKVTKETCSKKAIAQLMQNGYGPPQPEHCTKDEKGHSTTKVEFSFDLTNEAFRQKMIEIYPKLENACFVFMKADKINKLVELNPGKSCFRCYTPESIFYSERGQGRLYIRKITESEILQCNHGVSIVKRLRSMVGCKQPFYLPIAPKPAVTLTEYTLATSSMSRTGLMSTIVAPPLHSVVQGPLLPSTSVTSGLPVTVQDFSSTPPVLSLTKTTPPLHSSRKMILQNQSPLSTVVTQTPSTPVIYSFGTLIPHTQSPAAVSQTPSTPAINSTGNMIAQSQLPLSTVVLHTPSTPSIPDSGIILVQNQSALSAAVKEALSTPVTYSTGKMIPHVQSPAAVSQTPSTPAINSASNMVSLLPGSIVSGFDFGRPSHSDVMSTNSQPSSSNISHIVPSIISTYGISSNTSMPLLQNLSNVERHSQSQAFVSWSTTHHQAWSPRPDGRPNVSLEQPIYGTPSQTTSSDPALLTAERNDRQIGSLATNQDLNVPTVNPRADSSFERWVVSPGLDVLANVAQREQPENSISSSLHVQGNLDLLQREKLRADTFFENVKSTSTLKISLAALDSDVLVKRLNESTINIHTVEIESTCKLHQVLSRYSLPSCLKALRINDNSLSFKDISDLVRCLSCVNSLHELDLHRTKFKEFSLYAFICVLRQCNSLTSLSLTDNGLTKDEVTSLITTFESMGNLKKLNLSKSIVTEMQANDMLHKLKHAKNITSLDLSQNALQGNEVIVGICQLQSLEEVDLSHNYIRFFPLPDFKRKHDSLSISIRNISLSSNHMTPRDISQFCSLIGSDVLKLKLDFNHVGNAIWSLCSVPRMIEHLKVLGLANTDICGLAVDGLAVLLSLVRELEELNLSSNNLILADFQQLQSPLSNLSQLRRLRLSNIPVGVSALLERILPSLKNLEELMLSNAHLNCDDLKRICHSLASLKGLKYLDLSMNAIGPGGIRELASIFKEFPLLERLDLSRSCLLEDDMMVLCQSLNPLKMLKYLNLSGNMINSKSLGDVWFLPSMLEELIFSHAIHGEKLFAKMKLLHNLKTLRLTNLKLRHCDVEMLASTLSSFSKLEELFLAEIVFADSSCDKILSAMNSLGNLRKLHLTKLKLRIYDSEVLATTFSSFLGLKELSLADIVFADCNCDKILSSVKSLGNLRKLHLTKLKLRACDIEVLAATLSTFIDLEELSLANIVTADSNSGKILSAIKSLGDIRKIDLRGIKLFDESALADMLSSLLSLEELVLTDMSVVHMNDERFFGAIKLLKRLRKLDLGGINVREEHAFFDMLSSLLMLEEIVFPAVVLRNSDCALGYFSALESLRYLQNVDLRWSKICNSAKVTLSSGLLSLQLLQRLMLGIVNHDHQKQLFTALGNFKYLRELQLVKMCISKNGAEAFVRILPSLHLLKKLVLEEIQFARGCGEQLFPALGNLKYLEELHLVKANIDTEALACVLPSLKLLEKLVLVKNYYDECNEQLFSALGNLEYLKELHVDGTGIPNTYAKALVRVLPSLQLLEKLKLGRTGPEDKWDEQLLPAIGNLKYLKELHIGQIFLTALETEALARVLPSLQFLEKLVLGKIYKSYDRQLFASLGNLHYLKELDLGKTFITKTGEEALARMLPSLKLEKLVLGEIGGEHECDLQLFAALGNLKYLKELHLQQIRISQTCAEALALMLRSLHLLENLMLKRIQLQHEYDEQLFAALGNFKYLKELHLVEMNITKPGAEALARVLPSLTLLEKLVLDFESVDGCNELFAALGSLKHLKELNLGDTYITKSIAEALARVLPSLQLLEKLVFGGINCQDECDEQLFAALGNLKYLKELDLGETWITKTGEKALASVLRSLKLLEKLVAFRIGPADEFDEQPEYRCDEQLLVAIGNLKYLKELKLQSMRISHNGAEALAHALPSLTLLNELQLTSITLEGDNELLHALGELKYLEKLNLHRTKLTKAGVAALADVLPSLGLLKKLLLHTSDERLFIALGSLSFLNELDLSYSTITQAGASALTRVLPILRNLKCFYLPKRIENDKDGTLEDNLKAAASFVPQVL